MAYVKTSLGQPIPIPVSADTEMAKQLAANAQNVASTANDNSETAKTTAEAAKSTAETAQTKANGTDTKVGTLENLQTIDKTSVVNALNENANKVGTLNNLQTTDKTSVVNALNENTSKIGNISNKTQGFINLAQYPRLPLETNDSPRLDRAFSSLNANDCLVLSGKQLDINTPFIINKSNVRIIADENVLFKAVSPISSCIKFQSPNASSVLGGVLLDKISVDANNLADYGICIDDTVGLYISNIMLSKIKVKNAKLDGIAVYGSTWNIYIDESQSEYNGRDGIRVIMKDMNQVNNVIITKCFIQSNGGNGITINGTNHTISNNDIERNQYGISFNTVENTVPGAKTWIFKNVAEKNYIELNKLGQIQLKVSTSNSINDLSITDNYLLGSNDVTHLGDSLIKTEGAGNITCFVSKNTLDKNAGNVVNDIDGANLFTSKSKIDNAAKVINPGLASVDNPGFKILPIPPSIIQTNVYGNNQKSDNILPLSDKSVKYPLPDTVNNRMVNSQNIFVETDCSNYTIRCWYFVKNIQTGASVKSGYTDITKTTSALITASLTNSIGYERRTMYEYMYFSFELFSSTGGTYLYFHIPFLEITK